MSDLNKSDLSWTTYQNTNDDNVEVFLISFQLLIDAFLAD